MLSKRSLRVHPIRFFGALHCGFPRQPVRLPRNDKELLTGSILNSSRTCNLHKYILILSVFYGIMCVYDKNKDIMLSFVKYHKPYTHGFTMNKESVFIDNEFDGCAKQKTLKKVIKL